MAQQVQTPEQQQKIIKMVWMAMLVSTVFYLGVGYMQMHLLPQTLRTPIANLVWGFAAVFAGMGFVVPNMLFKRDTGPAMLMQRYIVRYAMFESVAVLALLNFLTQGVSFGELVGGILAAFALILFNPPKGVRAT